MNKDITEWLMDKGIEPLCEIVNKNNETIFLSDLLDNHLTEQLILSSVVQRSELVCIKHNKSIALEIKHCKCVICGKDSMSAK